ncbi:MAG: IS1182 family transposase [Gammaproteobacteria bacterium]|nr:IS1182 family transposase [Gammaproteobacteria bacterium]
MPTTFRPYDPDQMLLMPPALRDWLSEGHLAHHVSDLVDGLDLGVFYAPYEGDGRRKSPYEPRMMLKVLIYGYARGVFSSRGIARKLEEDVAFTSLRSVGLHLRVLAAGNFPSHRTICEFRRRHLDDFKRLFVEVVRLAAELGAVRFGTLSIDGTKVRANASKRKAMSYKRMVSEERRLKAEIDRLVGRAGKVDAAEDERLGADVRGDEMPAGLKRRKDRVKAIREAILEAKARLEAAQREQDDARGRKPGMDRNPKGGRPYKRAYGVPEDKAQSNFTDPESGIMKTSSEGFQQCYNAQLAVDDERQLIVAAEVTANASDQGQLLPRLDEVEAAYGAVPERVLADAGYCNERDLLALEERGVDGYVALGREGKKAAADAKSRPAAARMLKKLLKPEGHAQYARRKWLSEAPNGWIKQAMGFRRFSVRGLRKVQGEWALVCLALNMKRMQGLQAA